MDKLVKDLPAEGKILWRVGTPTKYGVYLVLCNDSEGLRIHHDVWFDNKGKWQSQYHNLVAWCCLDDIELITILPEKLDIQVSPFSVKWRLAQEQLLALNEWIDKQYPIEKDERQD